MSRATGQLTTPPKNIFITEITQQDGTKTHVMSARPLSDQSVRITNAWNAGALFLLMTLSSQHNVLYRNLSTDLHKQRLLCANIWNAILGFSFGLSQHGSDPLASLGSYAIAIRRLPSLFQAIEMNPSVIVDAAIRGQEDMVLNILQADPSYLLKKAPVKNSVGVEHTVTPLQAAIMADDVQLVEKMQEHFTHLPNGIVAMQEQILQIYKESLRAYFDKQEAEIEYLNTLKKEGQFVNHIIVRAQYRSDYYLTALRSDDINTIFKAHNQAQEDNAFDFQPYVDAILNASRAELDDVMALIDAAIPAEIAAVIARTGVAATQTPEARAKSFDELTLVEKLNRFREEFVSHMQQEIIFNPRHILTGLKANETVWDTLSHVTDPNYKKRSIIFSQLVGWTQRKAAEPVKQDIRQGVWCLIKENESRTRQSLFNEYRNGDTVRNSLADVSLVDSLVVGGLGYKFARELSAGTALVWLWGGGAGPGTMPGWTVKTYIEQKQQVWKTCAVSTSSPSKAPVCSSVA